MSKMRIEGSFVALITPFNAGFQLNTVALIDPSTPEGVAMVDRMVTGQANTIAYQNDFLLMTLMGLLCLPLVLAFRNPKRSAAPKPAAKQRASVPSWDEILFGTRPPEG